MWSDSYQYGGTPVGLARQRTFIGSLAVGAGEYSTYRTSRQAKFLNVPNWD
jgi:hypothetical protein